MHLNKILTKEFLKENLIENKISIMQLAITVQCCKHMIIKYCKKYNIYDEVKKYSKWSKPGFFDLTNRIFDKLTVKEIGTNDNFGKTRWICECQCGRKKIVSAASLIRNLTKSCGYCADRHNFKGYEEISGVYWRRIISSAEKRCIEFNTSPQYVWEVYLRQNKKCALSGIDICFFKNQDKGSLQTASIDRINSNLGYMKNNIQIVHKRVQKLKDVVPNDEFIFWCKLIYCNHKQHADELILDISSIRYHDK